LVGRIELAFTVEPALLPEKTVKSSADRPDTAKPGQPSASSADAIAAPIGRVHGTSKRGVQHIEPSLIKQAAKAPQRTAVARTDLSKLQQ
jgi:fructose/tagatose bisphosphate aldolase